MPKKTSSSPPPGFTEGRTMCGVITIYISISMLLILALICTVIESARVSAIRSRVTSVGFMSIDSVFSEFAEPIFDEYGVMMLWKSSDEVTESFSDYATQGLSKNSLSYLIFTDLYGSEFKEADIAVAARPTDSDGAPFRQQVTEYMELYIAGDLISKLLENISIFDQADTVNSFVDRIEDYGDTFKKVEKSASKVKDTVDEMKEKVSDPYDSLSDIMDLVGDYEASGSEDIASKVSDSIKQLKKDRKSLNKYLNDIEKESDRYYGYTEDAKAAVDELDSALNIESDGLDPDVYQAVKEQIDDIRQKSADTDFDQYNIVSTGQAASKYSGKLGNLDELFDVTEDELTEENLGTYKNILERQLSNFSDISLDDIHVDLDSSEINKEDDGFLASISTLFSDGLLAFIAGDVSEEEVETADFPSKTVEKSSSNTAEAASEHKVLFSEYVLEHFGNAIDKKSGTALNYEAEYIISGKSSDKDNLASVVSQIVLIRSGCNLISLLKDSEKKAEASALASSLVGFTGMPIVIKIFEILVIAAWAMAESIADAKALLEGHKVPTIKESDEWTVSIWGLKNFGQEEVSSKELEKGLKYQSYLRLLLLATSNRNLNMRTMDMIQVNMQKNENSDFLIANCICAVSGTAAFEARPLFSSFGFVKSVTGGGSSLYSFTIPINYSY